MSPLSATRSTISLSFDRACTTWTDPRFIENIDSQSAPRTIHDSWATTLIEALREAKNLKRARVSPAEPQEPAEPVVTPARVGPKILIIDDTEMLLIFVEDSLELADPTLQITTALTGLAGVNEAARIMPDLILADYVLPDIRGDEVCRRIGRNEKTARVPIIMLSFRAKSRNLSASAQLNPR